MDWQKAYQKWQTHIEMDEELRQAMANYSPEEAQEAFTGALSFGTAGMRGILGPGTNRMNRYTVRQATEGLAQLIIQHQAQERGVAIAYDSRHFSPEFAQEAACVLGHHGIQVYLYERLRPTPVLSFAVRYFKAYAGIMITASHNPAEYNGYKVYGEDGGQMPPVEAGQLMDYVSQVADPLEVATSDFDELVASGKIKVVGDQVDQAYLDAMKSVTIDSELIQQHQSNISIVYTPLHGAGMYLGLKALKQAGFEQIHVVASQQEPDGAFPTVKSPNPESPEAFDEALKLAKEVRADIILATDPDADRLGAMIRTATGDYQLLTGNQIAAIMLDYLLAAAQSQGSLPTNGVVVKSIVSTDLVRPICQHYGVEVEEVLTGFKFIAEKIKGYEQSETKQFLMGFEESYGYLIRPFVRDKDAIQALVVLAELTAYHQSQGRTLGDALESIYQRYGCYYEHTIAITYPGLDGAERMRQIMAHIRQQGPSQLGEIAIVQSDDYLTSQSMQSDGHSVPLTLPTSDALKYHLTDGSWVALRPSGTEPKIKLYIATKADSMNQAEAKAQRIEADLRTYVQ